MYKDYDSMKCKISYRAKDCKYLKELTLYIKLLISTTSKEKGGNILFAYLKNIDILKKLNIL